MTNWFVPLELRLAAARWLGGFGNPRLAGWLARSQKTAKIRSAPLYRLFSPMVWVWGWVCKGGGGSATFQEHPYLILQVALPSEPPIKTKNTNHRITALDVCSTANVVVAHVNLRVHNCPQSEIETIHIAIYIQRHLSKEHLCLQLLILRHVTQHKVIHLLGQNIVTLILVMGKRHVIMHHVCKRNCFVSPIPFANHGA